jgi:hypothetical protein
MLTFFRLTSAPCSISEWLRYAQSSMMRDLFWSTALAAPFKVILEAPS